MIPFSCLSLLLNEFVLAGIGLGVGFVKEGFACGLLVTILVGVIFEGASNCFGSNEDDRLTTGFLTKLALSNRSISFVETTEIRDLIEEALPVGLGRINGDLIVRLLF